MKVLIVGFDGATWDLINKFDLPNFKKLAENGVTATMKSTYPPITIPAWPCMFSGYNPGKIGAVDFKRRREGNKFELVNSSIWKGKLLWDRLKSLKFLILNIPSTYPPYKINGDIVAIDFSPLTGYTYPPELQEELESKFDINSIRNFKKLNTLYEKEMTIYKIFNHLTNKKDYDVAIVRFGIPDHVTHKTTRLSDIEQCHYLMDELLEKVIKSSRFDYLFIVSDHGVMKSEKRFCINTWLYKKGYLNLTTRGKMYLTFMKIYKKLFFRNQLKIMLKFLLKNKLNKSENTGIPRNILNMKNILNNINYNESRAFGILSISLKQYPIYLQINDLNNEYEYNKLIKKLSNELLSIKDDNNKTVIKKILTKNELYSGEHLDKMPDLIIESRYCILSTILPELFTKIMFYTHTMNGIFAAYGKDIRKNIRLDTVQIYDIVPTILHILGFPIPKDIDGRVLTKIFDPNSKLAKSNPVYVKAEYYDGYKNILKNKIKQIKYKL